MFVLDRHNIYIQTDTRSMVRSIETIYIHRQILESQKYGTKYRIYIHRLILESQKYGTNEESIKSTVIYKGIINLPALILSISSFAYCIMSMAVPPSMPNQSCRSFNVMKSSVSCVMRRNPLFFNTSPNAAKPIPSLRRSSCSSKKRNQRVTCGYSTGGQEFVA